MALLPGPSPSVPASPSRSLTRPTSVAIPRREPPDIGADQSRLGSGIAAPPATFVVTKTADDGSAGTLRWAVDQADSVQSTSTITFNLGSTPQTVTLSQGQLELSNPLVLDHGQDKPGGKTW